MMMAALKSFFDGFCSVLGFFPGAIENPCDKYKNIEEALASDWRIVGDDMRKAIQICAKELEEKNAKSIEINENNHGKSKLEMVNKD